MAARRDDAAALLLVPVDLPALSMPSAQSAPEQLRDLADTARDVHPDATVTGRGLVPLLPSARAVGVLDDVDDTRELGDAYGDLLAACGIELLTTSLLGVATGPDPAVGTDAFGSDPDLVTRHARALASGIRDAGVAVGARDFPGTGAIQRGEGSGIRLGQAELERTHLPPWELAPWLDAVVTAPVDVPALGPGSAALAPWAPALLEQISHGGYHGLVVAGRLETAAEQAGISLGEAAVQAVTAGAHLLELSPDASLTEEAPAALLAAAESGRLPEGLLAERAEATRRILRSLRARRRWLPTPEPAPAAERLAEVSGRIARAAVEIRRAVLDLRPAAVIDLADPVGAGGSAGGPADAAPGAGAHLVAALRRQGIAVEPHAYAHDALAAPTLLVITARPRGDDREAARLQGILSRRPDAIAIHTGLARHAPDAERRVLAHGAGPVMMAAVVSELMRS